MLKDNSVLIVRGHRVLDICLTVAAFVGAYFIKRDYLPIPWRGLITEPNYYVVLLMAVIIWYVAFHFFDLYFSFKQKPFSQILWNIVKAVSTAMLILILSLYVVKITHVSRIMMGLFFFLDIGLLALSKWIIYSVQKGSWKNGYHFRNLLIVGSRDRAKDVIAAVGDSRRSGLRIKGCLELNQDDVGKTVENGVEVIATLDHLEKILREDVVDELVFAIPLKEIENAEKHIAIAGEMGVSVRVLPDWRIHHLMTRPVIASVNFEDFFGIPSMAFSTGPDKQGELLLKAIFDYLIAGISLILLSPLLLAIAVAIRVSSSGPIFFSQVRSGLNGRRFKVYKFRTMVSDAEAKRRDIEHLNETDGPVFKIRKDPRIIPYLGTFLRRTGLDELPQLLNVVKGEMSIVGPRPPIPSEVEKYDLWQRRRLSMKPGMTCLWQTSQNRNDVAFEDWMKLDLEYIDNWSLKLDFMILLRTVGVVLCGEGR